MTDTIDPTAGVRRPAGTLSIHLLWSVADRSMCMSRLEAMHFLLNWKIVQEIGTPLVNLRWINARSRAYSPELLATLRKDIRLLINPLAHGSQVDWQVQPNVREEVELPAELLACIDPYRLFLAGRSTEQLQALCVDSFPMRTTTSGQSFMLDERLLAYRRTKRSSAAD